MMHEKNSNTLKIKIQNLMTAQSISQYTVLPIGSRNSPPKAGSSNTTDNNNNNSSNNNNNNNPTHSSFPIPLPSPSHPRGIQN